MCIDLPPSDRCERLRGVSAGAQHGFPLSSRFLRISAQRRPTAVYGYDRPVDEARLGGEQVGDGRRDLLGTSHPSDRMQEAHLLFDPRGLVGFLASKELFVTLGGYGPQGDGVGPDSSRSVVD